MLLIGDLLMTQTPQSSEVARKSINFYELPIPQMNRIGARIAILGI